MIDFKYLGKKIEACPFCLIKNMDFNNYKNLKIVQLRTYSYDNNKDICEYFIQCYGCDVQSPNYSDPIEMIKEWNNMVYKLAPYEYTKRKKIDPIKVYENVNKI